MKKCITKGVADVPVILQLETLECGAACLAMILAYFQKWVPLEKVRCDCGVSRDGSNAKNIAMAAENYGLEVHAYKYEPEMFLTHGCFPCIIHWNFDHFVVLKGIRRGKVYINDPERGSCCISKEEFDRSFTGVCLQMSPTEKFVPDGKRESMFLSALGRLKSTGQALAFFMATSILISAMELISPAFSRVFMDRLLTKKSPEWLYPFLALFTLLCILQTAVRIVREVHSLRIRGKIAVSGSAAFMWKVLHLPMEFFSQRMAGDIQQRQEANGRISLTLVQKFAPLIWNMLMLIFYLAVMIRYNAVMAAVGILAIIPELFLSKIIADRRINITKVQLRDKGKLAAMTVNGIDMIESIKASGSETAYFQKWADCQADMNTQNVKYAKLNSCLGMLPAALTQIFSAVILCMGIREAMLGNMTVGMVLAFQGFLGGFFSPASQLIDAGQSLQEMRAETQRVDDVMDYPCDSITSARGKECEEYDKLTGNIQIKNVTFGYSKLGKPIIKNFSLDIKAGSSVAIVGASGCGKSTISKLISGLYQPWEGEILFDGKRIEDIDRNVFTGSLAVVDQDIILFEDTIAANIRMWDNSIEDFEVIMAARDAQIHEDIMKREGGYQYRITEGGSDLSGGQRQRIEIARVLAQDPTMIIMDEATSALDAKTEYDVVRSIKNRGITCIIAAHRLSAIRDCDEIIVMDGGEIAQRGTHEQLLAKGGRYAQLVSDT